MHLHSKVHIIIFFLFQGKRTFVVHMIMFKKLKYWGEKLQVNPRNIDVLPKANEQPNCEM